MADLGYDCGELNLGCPSPTVTKKGRGSGILRDPGYLQADGMADRGRSAKKTAAAESRQH